METAKTVTVVFSGWPSDQLLWREGCPGRPLHPSHLSGQAFVSGVSLCAQVGLLVLVFLLNSWPKQ